MRAIDSTTIELIANCMNWAQHRKRKAAAKMHMTLDTASFLPVRIIVEPAKGHDANYMVELCAGMKAGETAVFDKEVVLVGRKSRSLHPGHLRLVRAWVKDSDGNDKLLTFLTNNFEWTAGSVCDLYRSRRAIETFFKEIKQTLQLKTFIG